MTVSYTHLDVYKRQLQRDGIRIETRQEYSDYIDAAYVLKQSIDPGTVIQSGDTIVLTISKGSYQPPSPSLILEDTTEEENDPSSAQDQPCLLYTSRCV